MGTYTHLVKDIYGRLMTYNGGKLLTNLVVNTTPDYALWLKMDGNADDSSEYGQDFIPKEYVSYPDEFPTIANNLVFCTDACKIGTQGFHPDHDGHTDVWHPALYREQTEGDMFRYAPDSAYTLMCWVYFDSAWSSDTTTRSLFYDGFCGSSGSTSNGINIRTYGSSIWGIIVRDTHFVLSPLHNPHDVLWYKLIVADWDKWHFVALTIDSDNLCKLYINGSQVPNDTYNKGEVTHEWTTPDGPTTVGAAERIASHDGYIDELRIIKETLSAEDIEAIYNDEV